MRERVVEEFRDRGSVNAAAQASGPSHSAATVAGLVTKGNRASKGAAKVRFLELIDEGWSTAGASREVGAHPRTGRDWRRGIRKSNNTRVYPDGTVVDYRSGTRYFRPMSEPSAVISDRYLSLDDRLAIADGLVNRMTLTAIAAGIGKHVSSVSRELKSTTQAAQHRRPLPALSGPWRCSGKASGVATTP